MPSKILKSVKGRRLRLTRLDATGDPIVGACSSLVTGGFVQVTIGNELEAGEEYSQKNAWGEFCVNEKDGDIIKWVNVGITLCMVHPDALDIIAGANPVVIGATVTATVNNKALASNVATLTTAAAHGISVGQTVTITGVDSTFNGSYTVLSTPTSTTFTYAKTAADVASAAVSPTGVASTTGTTIGATFGPNPNSDGFAVEVWTRNAQAGIASPTEWGYFIVPWCKNGQLDGDVTIENGVMNLQLKGEGYAASANWGVNPYGDNPLLMAGGFPAGDLWGVVTTTVQPPAETDGCVAIEA
jgi:hypothetical protein